MENAHNLVESCSAEKDGIFYMRARRALDCIFMKSRLSLINSHVDSLENVFGPSDKKDAWP